MPFHEFLKIKEGTMNRFGDSSGDGDNLISSPTRDSSSRALASLLNQPIVMDMGTGSIKAGFAGGAKPKVNIGTKVGRVKHMRVMPGGALEQQEASASHTSVFVGSKLDEHRGAFVLDFPMNHGHVVRGGWTAMEHIIEVLDTFSNENLPSLLVPHYSRYSL
jgi:actin-related protein